MEHIASAVRIWHSTAKVPVGVGFRIDDMHIVTCAHVVLIALGLRSANSSEIMGKTVDADFPACASSTSREHRVATVVGWREMGGLSPEDVAILRLDVAAPTNTSPISINAKYDVGNRILSYGVRAGLPDGAYVDGNVFGPIPGPLIQVTANHPDLALREGCSGGAAWNLDTGCVIGMVTKGQLQMSGLLTPIGLISSFYSEVTTNVLQTSYAAATDFADAIASGDVALFVAMVRLLPRGPGVNRSLIRNPVVQAFAQSSNAITGPGVVAEASSLVLKAMLPQVPPNRHAYVVDPAALGESRVVGMLHYWSDVFDQACPLGPRMVGAILLTAPQPVVNGARQMIVELFLELERWK